MLLSNLQGPRPPLPPWLLEEYAFKQSDRATSEGKAFACVTSNAAVQRGTNMPGTENTPENHSPGNSVDRSIGSRLSRLREAGGMSRPSLAALIGVADNLVEDWESGCRRITAVQLFRLAKVLSVPLTAFFEQL